MKKVLLSLSLFFSITTFSQCFYKVKFLKINTVDTIFSYNISHKIGDSIYVHASTMVEFPEKVKQSLRAVILSKPFYFLRQKDLFTNFNYDVTNKEKR